MEKASAASGRTSVRVRIAPAPSGSLHIGNARTALYNWLFARKNRGVFILRIEDTDRERARPENIGPISDELRWLGLDYDEGPDTGGSFGSYVQSERLERYAEAAGRLLDAGLAYRCYHTPDELAAMRERALAEHRRPGYDGTCYRLSDAQRRAYVDEGRSWVVRFHTPDEGETTIDDAVVGTFTVKHSEIEDFPILRQSGFPLYVLGAAVDDALMEVSHVIRGTDLQDAAPRQKLLLDALGYPTPKYAHIPLVFLPGGQRLRKRIGGGSVEWYREHGFLPDAVVNALVLMGTGFGDETIVSRREMIEAFSLDRVHPSPAIFNQEKLDWMNGEYLRMMPDDALAGELTAWLQRAGLVGSPPSEDERLKITAAAPVVKTRMKRLEEAPELIRSWFADVEPDPSDFEKVMRERYVPGLLEAAREALSQVVEWNVASVEAALRESVEAAGVKKQGFRVLYVALTGRAASAPLFDTVTAIGKMKAVDRLTRARSLLN